MFLQEKNGAAAEKEFLMKNNVNTRTQKMVQMAILVAIMLIFAYTPLGYLKVGLIEITFMVLPIAIGAIILGPGCGAILGGLFGVTSFIQCFGASAFGTFLLSMNPILTFITCMVPRILCGWLSGLIFQALKKNTKMKTASYFIGSLSTALLNTFFFMLCIIVFFWHSDTFLSTMTSWSLPTDSVWVFLVAFVGVNGVVEAVVNCIAAGTIAKVLSRVVNR